MKRVSRFLVVTAALTLFAATNAAAQVNLTGSSDAVCPATIAPIKALGALSPTADPAKISALARTVVQTYDECITTARTAGAVEPYMHYAQVRAAQYGILLGRALFAQKDYDGAHAAFVEARRLSTEVVEWAPPPAGYAMGEGGTWVTHNTGSTKSQLHDTALEVQKAANFELSKLVPTTQAP